MYQKGSCRVSIHTFAHAKVLTAVLDNLEKDFLMENCQGAENGAEYLKRAIRN